MSRKALRYPAAAASVVFVLTLAVLLTRRLDLGPERPAPDFRTIGDKTARVHIQEFTDFACPSCRAANEHLHKILEIYPGKIRLSLKHYPLGKIHKWSADAAAAADCAGKQGKFWSYADLLFKNQSLWAAAKEPPVREFISMAEELGLETGLFQNCIKEPGTAKAVQLDIAEGNNRGISATPTLFMNKKRIVGPGQLIEAAKLLDNLTQ